MAIQKKTENQYEHKITAIKNRRHKSPEEELHNEDNIK